MPLSRKKQAGYQRKLYWERKRARSPYLVTSVMSSANVRAIRKTGLRPEDVEPEASKVSSSVYYALLRDRDAIKAHLSWHHEAVKYPDVGTAIERQQAEIAQLQSRVTLLEAEQVIQHSDYAEEGYLGH